MLSVYPNTDEKLCDIHGHPLPACLVMERGTSLDVWAQKGKPDRFQAATVRFIVSLYGPDLNLRVASIKFQTMLGLFARPTIFNMLCTVPMTAICRKYAERSYLLK